MQHGPSNPGRFVGGLQGMTAHCFPITFAPYFRQRRHQEQKDAAFSATFFGLL
jgi:hypothetical protein